MFNLEKPQIDDKRFLTPSFSSTLLDQIYRSIDEGERKNGEMKFYRHTTMSTSKRQSRSNSKSMDAGDRKIVGAKNDRKKLHCDEDVMFFSSTSISSTDSSSLGCSSSDTESISRASCFAPRVGRRGGGSASFRSEKQGMSVFHGFCRNSSHRSEHEHSQLSVGSRHRVFMSKQQQRHEHVTAGDEDALMIKSKSRALRIYNNLKKVKQPISPGGRVTSFLNSLFANTKKTTSTTSRTCGEVNAPSSSSSCYYSSTCSSASTFSRSCLSKTMSSERDRLRNGGVKRTVRFYPVSLIVDEDSRPCGHKRLCEEEEASGEFLREYNRHNPNIKSNDNLVLKDLSLRKTNIINDGDYDDGDDDDDALSYASSDLFELDHLAVFGSGRYSEELPVYETTHFSTNRAIANGLIV